jgi:hypothetical protein
MYAESQRNKTEKQDITCGSEPPVAIWSKIKVPEHMRKFNPSDRK